MLGDCGTGGDSVGFQCQVPESAGEDESAEDSASEDDAAGVRDSGRFVVVGDFMVVAESFRAEAGDEDASGVPYVGAVDDSPTEFSGVDFFCDVDDSCCAADIVAVDEFDFFVDFVEGGGEEGLDEVRVVGFVFAAVEQFLEDFVESVPGVVCNGDPAVAVEDSEVAGVGVSVEFVDYFEGVLHCVSASDVWINFD